MPNTELPPFLFTFFILFIYYSLGFIRNKTQITPGMQYISPQCRGGMKNFFVAKNFRAINFCSPKCLCFEENFIIYSTQRRGKYSQKLIQGLSLLGKELPTLTCRLLSTFVVTMTTFWPLYPPAFTRSLSIRITFREFRTERFI